MGEDLRRNVKIGNTKQLADDIAQALGASNDWGFFVANWSVEPFVVSTTATGDIYEYVYGGETRYRFVPTIYDPTLDAFYSDLGLTELITTRG